MVGAPGVGDGVGGGVGVREVPQPRQKLSPGGFVRPQLAQGCSEVRLAPQYPQKVDSSGFSWPHDAQSIVARPRSPRGRARQYCAQLAALSTRRACLRGAAGGSAGRSGAGLRRSGLSPENASATLRGAQRAERAVHAAVLALPRPGCPRCRRCGVRVDGGAHPLSPAGVPGGDTGSGRLRPEGSSLAVACGLSPLEYCRAGEVVHCINAEANILSTQPDGILTYEPRKVGLASSAAGPWPWCRMHPLPRGSGRRNPLTEEGDGLRVVMDISS